MLYKDIIDVGKCSGGFTSEPEFAAYIVIAKAA